MADYLFESARVRTLEAGLPTRERMELLIAAKDFAEMTARLAECGVSAVTDDEGNFLREETLQRMLQTAYDELSEVMARDAALRLWLYPYDCNNVKAAMKGFIRGADPREMMFDFGTASIADVVEMVQRKDFDGLPASMRAAAAMAMEAYAKSKNPQTIDLMLDRACFADMLDAAKSSGEEFAIRLVQMKIDLINLITVVRILRMGQRDVLARPFLEEALLGGGTLTEKTLLEWFDGGEDYLWNRLYHTPLGKLSESLAGREKTLTEVERFADDLLMQTVREARFAAYGAEVLIAYLLATEYTVRNLRIVFAGKATGLAPETIRERMRDAYV